ncbi:MAG: PGPGW domain-containing protein [Planctomycetes bacterium]|nr:PGPGW domain-containing protein [Planctomycetota bacterium]
MGLRKSMQKSWQALKESPPGRRFQDRYDRQQQNRRRPLGWRRVLKIATGVGICLAGVFLMPAPGPGWGVFILGAAVISDEFLWVARVLDWAELRLRSGYQRTKDYWRHCRLSLRERTSFRGAKGDDPRP